MLQRQSVVGLHLPVDVIALIDRLASKELMTRAAYIRRSVLRDLESQSSKTDKAKDEKRP